MSLQVLRVSPGRHESLTFRVFSLWGEAGRAPREEQHKDLEKFIYDLFFRIDMSLLTGG